ncbi:MAG: ATP-binding protein [Pseudomonadota bacterium]
MNLSVKELGEQVEIAVADTGIGIPERARADLFQPFERLESRLKVKAGGTGLGLYLTKKMAVDLLAGQIDWSSKEGVGSTFVLRLARDLRSDSQEPRSDGEY